ncbi:tripartite tricarboxylate transporter TctB family protein [Blastococcus sp. VKM Ac-2987]|uniref:tripartite tricarboxylate transporter TctB family protein n=1 Tax=Blastococcus sp. VKM Ac-2987 TaxID=3004141 RepID=UPI0022AB6881|nr:tripartite tricarboxylate transporter TctB family protein [Blastococcus sp. VKM Ac-2987]MCZ2856933.1 tripartite tricarboxylate transporter TctB family protein [Blastococcus sp. VKM Ac-2987]
MSSVPESAAARGGASPAPAPRQGAEHTASEYEDEDLGGPLSPLPDEEPALPRWVGIVTAAVPLALGIAGAFGAVDLGVGSISNPGPGLWPLVLSAAMVVASVALLALGHGLHGAERFGRGWRITAVATLSLIVFTYLFEPLGFEITTLLLMAFWLKIIGKETWRMTLTIAVGTTVVVYLVFIMGLSVNLPRLLFF